MRSGAALISSQPSAREESVEELCVNSGLKMTGQRRVVARVLSEAVDPPDVEELYRRALCLRPHFHRYGLSNGPPI
jgi:Fur family ferric uptake transcriptional regulator